MGSGCSKSRKTADQLPCIQMKPAAMKKTIRSTTELHDYMRENMPLLKTAGDEAATEQALENTISNVTIAPAYTSDIWIYRMVVICLAVAILAVVIGVIIITVNSTGSGDINQKIPVILVSIISTAVGALAGLLAPSPNQSRNQ